MQPADNKELREPEQQKDKGSITQAILEVPPTLTAGKSHSEEPVQATYDPYDPPQPQLDSEPDWEFDGEADVGSFLEKLRWGADAWLICEAALQNAGPLRAPSSKFPQHSLALDLFFG